MKYTRTVCTHVRSEMMTVSIKIVFDLHSDVQRSLFPGTFLVFVKTRFKPIFTHRSRGRRGLHFLPSIGRCAWTERGTISLRRSANNRYTHTTYSRFPSEFPVFLL